MKNQLDCNGVVCTGTSKKAQVWQVSPIAATLLNIGCVELGAWVSISASFPCLILRADYIKIIRTSDFSCKKQTELISFQINSINALFILSKGLKKKLSLKMSKKNKEIIIENIYCILFLAWYCEGTAAFEVNNLTNGRLPQNIFALCCLVWATRGIHFRHHTTANTLRKNELFCRNVSNFLWVKEKRYRFMCKDF